MENYINGYLFGILKRGEGMKLHFILIFLVLLATPVYAAATESIQNGFDWLVAQSTNGNYKDIQSTAIAALALKESQSGYDQGELAVNYLLTLSNKCWPATNCQVKETALVLRALDEYSKTTDDVLAWFESSQTPATATGDWYLEVITTGAGQCKVSYLATEKQVKVSVGHFPDCQNSTFFDLNVCLEPGLLNKNPSIDFTVNCAGLASGTKIAMVYQSGTSYYLISEAATTQTTVSVRNACYGATAKSPCAIEPGLYANWALKKARSTITVLPWLEENYIKTNALQTALLYLSSENVDQLTSLKQMQSTDGSFDVNIFSTAIAALALKEAGNTQEFESAKAWLILKQRQDGSWGDIFTTSAVLYAIYDGEPITFRAVSAVTTEGVCNNNNVCETSFGENSFNCAADCFCGDNICDSTEDSSSCPADCGAAPSAPTAVCGNGVCEATEDSSSCEVDCPKGGFPFWIIILIILLLAGAFFLYFKFYRKKEGAKSTVEKPTFALPTFGAKPKAYRPAIISPKSRFRKSRTEEELEKSLSFARKILRK